MSTGGPGDQSSPPPPTDGGNAPAGSPSDTSKPMLRYIPTGPGKKDAKTKAATKATTTGAGSSGIHRGTPPPNETLVQASEDDTEELPPDYYLPDIIGGRSIRPLSRRAVLAGTSLVVLLAIVAGAVFLPWHSLLQHSNIPFIGGCGDGSACQAANKYLDAYTGGDYEAMYALTSDASRQRFSAPAIIGKNFKDAHDYIVNRTASIINEAGVISMRATPGDVVVNSDTSVTIPVQMSLSTQSAGDISQDIKIPLVNQQGGWKVDWSPGLIFSQLDSASDPTYQRLVHLFTASGHRGQIVDRDGNVLAKDDTVYQVGVIRGQISNESALDKALGDKLDLTPDQVKAAYQGGDASSVHVVRTITAGLYNSISGSIQLPGVKVSQTTGRVYPYGSDLAAVTGYVQGVSPDDLNKDKQHYYAANDVIGKAGLELWGEQYLRPVKGGTLVIADRNADGTIGKQDVALGQRQGGDGAVVRTSISLAEQRAAMQALAVAGGRDGGAMVVDPPSGEVRVMASYPMYDPNDLSLGLTPNEQQRLNDQHGYVNRAVAAVQPIGSVFKVVTLSAGLEHGVKPTDVYNDPGVFQVPGASQVSHENGEGGCTGHSLTAPAALGPSCDVVFWAVAVQLNSQNQNWLSDMGKAYGLGQPANVVGVPDGVENPGLMPDPDWLKKTQNANWSPQDAANIGIGQGALLANPAQIAMISAALADNGKRMQPHMVTQVITAEGAVAASFSPKAIGSLPLSASTLQIVQIAMLGPTNDPSGTNYAGWRDFPIQIASKTGTAESCTNCDTPPQGWFTAYAPGPTITGPQPIPQLAAGVLVEFSGFAADTASPVTKAIFKAHDFTPPASATPTVGPTATP